MGVIQNAIDDVGRLTVHRARFVVVRVGGANLHQFVFRNARSALNERGVEGQIEGTEFFAQKPQVLLGFEFQTKELGLGGPTGYAIKPARGLEPRLADRPTINKSKPSLPKATRVFQRLFATHHN